MKGFRIISKILLVFIFLQISFIGKVSAIDMDSESDNSNEYTLTSEENNSEEALLSNETAPEKLYLSDVDYVDNLSFVSFSKITLDKSIENTPITLIVDGKTESFEKGVAAHANSSLVYDLTNIRDYYSKFHAFMGIDAAKGNLGNGVNFRISLSKDGKQWQEVYHSTEVQKGNKEAIEVTIDIADSNYLKLEAFDLGEQYYDHSEYGDAYFIKKHIDDGTSAEDDQTEPEEENPSENIDESDNSVAGSTVPDLETADNIRDENSEKGHAPDIDRNKRNFISGEKIRNTDVSEVIDEINPQPHAVPESQIDALDERDLKKGREFNEKKVSGKVGSLSKLGFLLAESPGKAIAVVAGAIIGLSAVFTAAGFIKIKK